MAIEALKDAPENVTQTQFARQRFRSSGPVNLVRRYTPFWWRRALYTPFLLALDGVDFILGKHNELIPPRYLDFAGHGRFVEAGQEYVGYLRDLCGLQPQHRVLDIGCGIGRVGVALTKYLTTGSYEGLDIVPSGIRWCQRNVTPKYPRFHFQVTDVYNKMYNPSGRFKSAEYKFPFSDGEFDVVFLISVFTHLLPDDLEHYVSEIARVLRPGGKCLFSAFLLDDEARRGMAAGKSAFDFKYKLPGCWTSDPATPETAVAFEESTIAPLLKRYSLIADPTHFGAWSGRNEYFSYGDIVTSTKASPGSR
jgi:SAM-dependent methyltransferase